MLPSTSMDSPYSLSPQDLTEAISIDFLGDRKRAPYPAQFFAYALKPAFAGMRIR